jgi:hypothetical protein
MTDVEGHLDSKASKMQLRVMSEDKKSRFDGKHLKQGTMLPTMVYPIGAIFTGDQFPETACGQAKGFMYCAPDVQYANAWKTVCCTDCNREFKPSGWCDNILYVHATDGCHFVWQKR